MTKPEVMLWTRLRSRSDGFSFRRQHPMGPYVADFYCAKAKLIIEIDGEVHATGNQPARDQTRDRYFEVLGIETMRISSAEFLNDPDDISDGILRYVREKLLK
jgi:very-short-patch-repair endonuclease